MTELSDFNFAEDDFIAAYLSKLELLKSKEEEDLDNLAKLLNQIIATKVAKISQEKDEFYGKQLALKDLESETFYNHSPCGYFSTSANGIINKINDTLLAWLGYAKEDIIGKVTWQSLLSAGGKMYFETHYYPLLQMQGFVQEISFEMVKKDKTRLPILINTKQIRDENGKVQVNDSTVFDVSQRKSYEKELLIAKRAAEDQNKLIIETNKKLLASEVELTKLNNDYIALNENLNELVEYTFKNASIPIYFVLEDASIYNFNDIAAENLGYTSEELHKLKVYDLDKDYDEKKWASVWAKLKANKKITIETQQKKKDGTLIDVIITANYVKYGDLELNCSFVLDITEKKKVERQLNLLDYSYKNTDSAMSFLDVNGLFIDYNQATANMLGYSYEEFRGKTLMDINPMVTKEFWVNRWEELKVTPNQKFEAKFKRKDGTLIDVAVSTNSIELDGKIVNLGFYEDITEKKKLLKELVENNLELKQFSYITTHNLRAPLTNLVSICDIIQPGTGTDALTLQLIDGFKTSTHHLNETLEDLIEILIIKENRNIRKDQLTFEEIFKKISESLSMSLLENKVIINVDFSDAPSVIFANAYLESIFLNLLTNAVKYRHLDRDPIITIKTNKEPNGDTKLTFSDNGIGINMALAKDKIFGLYKRFHKNSDSKGIGLYLIHSQLTALGGNIEVESEVNIGTTFKIIFK